MNEPPSVPLEDVASGATDPWSPIRGLTPTKADESMNLHDKLHKFTWATAAATALAATFTIVAAPAVSAAPNASYHGTFSETAVGDGLLYDIRGSAKMTITSEATDVRVNVSGLDPTKAYGSHLHNGTCASGGGGHYQDVEGGGTTPPNELWLTNSGTVLRPNKGGVAHGSGSANWVARTTSTTKTNALSVVVHEPGGARIACADLG